MTEVQRVYVKTMESGEDAVPLCIVLYNTHLQPLVGHLTIHKPTTSTTRHTLVFGNACARVWLPRLCLRDHH